MKRILLIALLLIPFATACSTGLEYKNKGNVCVEHKVNRVFGLPIASQDKHDMDGHDYTTDTTIR